MILSDIEVGLRFLHFFLGGGGGLSEENEDSGQSH